MNNTTKYKLGDKVFAVVKGNDFKLHVTDGVVSRIDDTSIAVEKAHNSLTSSVYTFPLDEIGRSIQDTEEAAAQALQTSMDEQRYNPKKEAQHA